MSKVIGIDLGTTNSCVCVVEAGEPLVIPNDEGSRTTPSVVGFGKDGEQLVGQIARRQAVISGERTVSAAKRLIGRRYDDEEVSRTRKHVAYKIVEADNGDAWIRVNKKDWSPQQISAIVLDKMKAIAEAYLGERVSEAVITVPAYFNDSQRQATKDAGRIAGLNVLRIINEPTAAGLAYGQNRKNRERIAVFDLGGGTFDISIMELEKGVFEVRSTNGDTFLGGEDFDNRVVQWAMEEFAAQTGMSLEGDPVALQRIKEAAEKAKHELSSATETDLHLPFISATPAGPLHLQLELSRARLEALCADLVDRLEEPCRKALKDARMKPSDLNAVILVGGMTRMPRIQEKVAEIFGMEPERGVNPDEVVAIGAALMAAVLKGEIGEVMLIDVSPLSLGIETKGGVFEPIISRNTHIPCKKAKIFTTAEDNQDMVRVHVLQGERELAEFNRSLGFVELHGLPPAPKGMPEIEVSFELSADGILNVTAKDRGTGKAAQARVVSNSGLSEAEIGKAIEEAEAHRDQDHERKSLAEDRNRLDGLIYATRRTLEEYGELLDPREAMTIRDALYTAEQSMDRDRRAVAAAHQELAVCSELLAKAVYAMARQDSDTIEPNLHSPAALGGGRGPSVVIDDELVDDEK